MNLVRPLLDWIGRHRRGLVALAAAVGAVIVVRIVMGLAYPVRERLSNTQVEPHGASRELFVVMHGYTGSPRKLADVLAVIRAKCPHADLLVPTFDSRRFSNADPLMLSADLDDLLERVVKARAAAGAPYEQITLVGHSGGVLMLRKAYVFALGRREDHPEGAPLLETHEWPERVSRFILLAGINRGWTLIPRPTTRPLWMQLGLRASVTLARATGTGRFILGLERGSPFVANLRVQWIRLRQSLGGELPPAYQLLGRNDGIVTAKDNQDLAAQPDFLTIRLHDTGHDEVVRFGQDDVGRYRREMFESVLLAPARELREAFSGAAPDTVAPAAPAGLSAGSVAAARPVLDSRVALRAARTRLGAVRMPGTAASAARATPVRARAIAWDHVARPAPELQKVRERLRVPARALSAAQRVDKAQTIAENAEARAEASATKTRVVFVLHGIRDTGQWGNKLRQVMTGLAGAGRDSLLVKTPRYERFAMVPFLLLGARQHNVRWFMDEYTEALAASPGAPVSFVGHSNGTYVLASALRQYATLRVDDVVFAGSVVPRHYEWDALMAGTQPRVKRLLNVMADGDWVVAIFPRLYELLYEHLRWGFLEDIGSGGYYGFQDAAATTGEVAYVHGDHGGALKPALYDDIARFAMGGNVQPASLVERESRNGVVELLSGIAPVVWAALLAFVVGVGWRLNRIRTPRWRWFALATYALVLVSVAYNV
jgi:hypothetical protein